MDEKYIYKLDRKEMKSQISTLSGFDKERREIKTISELIFSVKDKDISKYLQFLHLNGNVLLFGRPGTGKTSICYECMLSTPKASLYQINISSLISEKLGKTSKIIDELFQDIVEEAEEYPTYLLIEEIEAFFPNRNKSRDLEDMKRALTTFMHYLDIIIPNLMILCTTNYLQNLDPAIIRRFSYKFEVTNPCKSAIISFLTNKENPFESFFRDKSVNEKIADEIVKRNMTFADVKYIMRSLFLEKKQIEQVNGNALLTKVLEEDVR